MNPVRKCPKNICAHPDGYLVRIERGDLKWQAFVRYSRPNALAEAIKLRDRFYKICGPIHKRGPSKIGRSNTEVTGISETVSWKGTTPYHNFIVHACGRNKRFYYGTHCTREDAFSAAVAHRAKATGVKPSTLLFT